MEGYGDNAKAKFSKLNNKRSEYNDHSRSRGNGGPSVAPARVAQQYSQAESGIGAGN
jgi:hypothetical protein